MITRELWLDSFNSWYRRSKGDRMWAIFCGYCQHYGCAHAPLSNNPDKCPFDNEICATPTSYYARWHNHAKNSGSNSRWAKYWAKKIFKAIAEHGKEYITDRERGMIEEVLG